MIGIGRDITRAPLIAQNVPTSFPNPVTGNISPYLNNSRFSILVLHVEFLYQGYE